MRSIVFFVIFSLAFGLVNNLYAAKPDTIAVAFYNVENLYDVFNDPKKNDEEFLPEGKKKWTLERFNEKELNLSKVIRGLNDGKGPDIIGFAEVENKGVLETLSKKYLFDLRFDVAHIESPDDRGIDVALLYNKTKFKKLAVYGDSVALPDKYPTRLILHVVLKSKDKDTLHVFVNHWPSRRNGQDKSEINRVAAASALRKQTDILLAKNPLAKIVIIGDFNDEPENISIKDTLGAGLYTCDSVRQVNVLRNVSWERKSKGEGSLKYRDNWNLLDQIIISKGLNKNYICGSYTIFRPDYLIQKDGKYAGSPFPTYGGDKHLGGYSDHLAVFAKFVINR
ncbi:MAG: endonuclease/exonuclease/phosphatase family protein [Ignavibacteriales bacterium]|nr:endonuclease/exonuclease/phosphatase family protein [Ignavibacteriales bacterium]